MRIVWIPLATLLLFQFQHQTQQFHQHFGTLKWFIEMHGMTFDCSEVYFHRRTVRPNINSPAQRFRMCVQASIWTNKINFYTFLCKCFGWKFMLGVKRLKVRRIFLFKKQLAVMFTVRPTKTHSWKGFLTYPVILLKIIPKPFFFLILQPDQSLV